MKCIDCNSSNVSGPDHEGMYDCHECGAAWIPDVAALTTAEKIERIEKSGLQLAWDGCHKIYLLEDAGRVALARESGYDDEDIYPASDIRDLILDSCGLVFVSQIGAHNDDFDHPWNIDQCTEDIYAAAEAIR